MLDNVALKPASSHYTLPVFSVYTNPMWIPQNILLLLLILTLRHIIVQDG